MSEYLKREQEAFREISDFTKDKLRSMHESRPEDYPDLDSSCGGEEYETPAALSVQESAGDQRPASATLEDATCGTCGHTSRMHAGRGPGPCFQGVSHGDSSSLCPCDQFAAVVEESATPPDFIESLEKYGEAQYQLGAWSQGGGTESGRIKWERDIRESSEALHVAVASLTSRNEQLSGALWVVQDKATTDVNYLLETITALRSQVATMERTIDRARYWINPRGSFNADLRHNAERAHEILAALDSLGSPTWDNIGGRPVQEDLLGAAAPKQGDNE